MRKKHLSSGKYLSYAFFFVGFFVCIILVYFVWKVVTLFQESTFDGSHQFILTSRALDSHTVNIAVFTPADKTVSLFTIPRNNTDDFALPVPFDAEDIIAQIDTTSPDSLIHAMLFPKNPSFSNVAIVDAYKLLFFSTGAEKTIVNVQDSNTDLAKKYAKTFVDNDLYQEAKSLTIINATGKSGFGNAVSQMLSTIGANIISVGGLDTAQDKTVIQYTGEKSYTLSRLERIFGVHAVKSTNPSQVADITIVLGKDALIKMQ